MKNSVLELISAALRDELEDKAPKLPVQPVDRVLGPLKSPLVPKLVSVLGHIGLRASQMNAAPDLAIGNDALMSLMASELVREYGTKFNMHKEEITVRHDGTRWVVVAVPQAVVGMFVRKPGMS